MRFLMSYSGSFATALSLWPLASLVLTAPILAFLYHRDGRLHLRATAGAYLSVLYALSLVCFTLLPLPTGNSGLGISYGIAPQLNPLGFVGDLQKDGVSAIPQIVANIGFFVPLGLVFGRGFGWSMKRSMALGLLVSLLIETAQLTGLFFLYPHAYRTFDVDDLLWNVSGTAIGWSCARALEHALPSRRVEFANVTHMPSLLRRTVAFCLDMALVGVAAVGAYLTAQVAFSVVGARPVAADLAAIAAASLTFLAVEGIVPWLHDGSTPAGAVVRMSCQTTDRTPGRRLAFYAARLITLTCAMCQKMPSLVFLCGRFGSICVLRECNTGEVHEVEDVQAV